MYLVGCTNVGKSTLFNIFLQSDYCKVQAADLIQRATTSPWPGTTLNLLKFPIARPSGLRAFLRNKRLTTTLKLQKQERELRRVQLQKTRNIEYATLIGIIINNVLNQCKIVILVIFKDTSIERYQKILLHLKILEI